MPRGRRKQTHANPPDLVVSDSNSSSSAVLAPDYGLSDLSLITRDGIGQQVLAEITQSPPVDEDGEEIYIVEKILDKKIVDGKTQYYLKWQGYGPEYDTWEPLENLDCEELVEEFEKAWAVRVMKINRIDPNVNS
jgi:hypothetical protein